MGKRHTSTTKSGKYMNPTDQARKEARKRELKKNKKQRIAVRAAALKGKNPRDVIAELEKIDDMEFNVLAPPPLNEKVLKEKRRKLHETWHRVIKMYEREDPEQYVELKRLWHSYQNRKQEVVQQFEAVKNAENVSVDTIPLPSAMPDDMGSIPLPPMGPVGGGQPKSSILKKPMSVLDALKPKTCPGVPASAPPDLADYDDVDEEEEIKDRRKSKIRFEDDEQAHEDDADKGDDGGPVVDDIQRKMLQMAGQDVDQYMKEMEEVQRKTQNEKQAEIQSRLERLERTTTGGGQPPMQQQPLMQQHPPPPPQQQHPHMIMPLRGGVPIMYRPAPPPLRPGVAPPGVRLPPGPPPGQPPALPPGPPPGRPPMQPRFPMQGLMSRPQGVLSAAPQLNKEAAPATSSSQPPSERNASGVIEAKPQMRNLKSDITRFVPTNVKLRGAGASGSQKKRQSDPMTDVFKPPQPPQGAFGRGPQQAQQHTKDDAYAQFMKEMDQLLK